MTSPIRSLFQSSIIKTVRLTLLSSLVISTPLLYAQKSHHANHAQATSPSVMQQVREATKQYIDVNNAVSAGYGAFLGCVTGPDHGAMGVHYVNLSLYSSNVLDITQPEAIIYEPEANGSLRIVGVEYIVDAATWLAANGNTPPVLNGQVLQYVASPNRFNIPSFFELHVWAWRDNPQGAFVDWNNHVSCENQQ
jgi:hypothetical protein